MTRLSSSSPVAATTTSTVDSPAASREETSQASATTQVMSSSPRIRATRSGSCSMSRTSWPPAWRSEAMAVPTLPAPAMATFMPGPRRGRRRRPALGPLRTLRTPSAPSAPRSTTGPSGWPPATGACDLPASRAFSRSRAVSVTIRWRTSPSWPTRSPKSRRATPARVTATTVTSRETVRSARRLPAHRSGSSRSTSESVPVGSDHSDSTASGSSRRRTWSMVHDTVATVGIPRRR